MRAFFYIFMAMVQDDEAVQKQGLVCILYQLDYSLQDRSIMWNAARLRAAIPWRFAGGHICYNEPALSPLLAFGLLLIPSKFRARFRLHCGTFLLARSA
jgi:hypothetical protein